MQLNTQTRAVYVLMAMVGLVLIIAVFVLFKGNTRNEEFRQLKDEIKAYREEDKVRQLQYDSVMNNVTVLMGKIKRTDSLTLVYSREITKIKQRDAATINYLRTLPTNERLRFFSVWLSQIDTLR